MNHYFSRELVTLFWFGKSNTKHVTNRISLLEGITITKMAGEEFGKHLRCKNYFSLPQLIAFDFYMSVRENLHGVASKMKMINKGCHAIGNLPQGGWELDEFKAMVLRPCRSLDLFIVYGTAYEVSTITPTRDRATRILTYKGRTLTTKIKRIIGNKVTFGQRFGDKIFWSSRTYQERRGWKRWRQPIGMVNKKSLKILNE